MSASLQRHALGTQPLDEVEQDDRVGDHDADQHQEADQGADADRPAGEEQRREGADRRQREAEQDDERGDQRVEREHHHHVDQQDGDGHRREQAAEGLVLLLGHAGQANVDTGWDRAVGRQLVDLVADRCRDRARVRARDLGRDLRRGRAVDARDAALDVDLLRRSATWLSGTRRTVPTSVLPRLSTEVVTAGSVRTMSAAAPSSVEGQRC